MGPDQPLGCGSSPDPALDPLLLEQFVRPLLKQLHDWGDEARQGRRRLPLIGLNGPVGAGKSTLGRQLEALAPAFGLQLMVASIDDLYLSWPERGERLAGNPFGVSRVPPGSHDLPLLLTALANWRAGGTLRLPRFDKTLAGGAGDRSGWREQPCDALVLEGWLMGCRPLPTGDLEALVAAATAREHPMPEQTADLTPAGRTPDGGPTLSRSEWLWLPRWNRELADYRPLWQAMDALWVLRPLDWGLPRRWRFQAEARQRRAGGGWLPADQISQLVRASLCSLPPQLFQDPLVWNLRGGCFRGSANEATQDGPDDHLHQGERLDLVLTNREPLTAVGSSAAAATAQDLGAGRVQTHEPAVTGHGPPVGAVAWLDGRRRCSGTWLQASPSASSSATG